jgi:GH24 family phage-related lysozyme (muramidase)
MAGLSDRDDLLDVSGVKVDDDNRPELHNIEIAGLDRNTLQQISDTLTTIEGYKSKVYDLNDTKFTVGWGHTWNKADGEVQPGQEFTQEENLNFLVNDIKTHSAPVVAMNEDLKASGRGMNSNQITALTSLLFNTGPSGANDVLEAAKTYLAIPSEENKTALQETWMKHDKTAGTDPDRYKSSLSSRRSKEFSLFISKS